MNGAETRNKNAKGIAMKRPLSSRISDLAINNNNSSNGFLMQALFTNIIVSPGLEIMRLAINMTNNFITNQDRLLSEVFNNILPSSYGLTPEEIKVVEGSR